MDDKYTESRPANPRSRTAMLATYQSVATHGGVAAADPHRLIVMLMDGVLERVAQARHSIDTGAKAEMARLLHRAVAIVEELRQCLDHRQDGSIAGNLDSLYEYMARLLMQASLHGDTDKLTEVAKLMNEIRSAWLALPNDARALRVSQAT